MKAIFCVISKEPINERGLHDIQSSNCLEVLPSGEEYATVPSKMIEAIMGTHGYCDIKLNKKGTEVTSFKAKEIPTVEKPEPPVSETEQLKADLEYLAIMTGVTL